ncbi:MAG: hypothetical protein A2X40_10105 [Elusimicrobia bacterium GWC2_65_9]|nr:MAG: hypothetical protein A2X40_10105 [Elusimicrobia bacterium GWC2_65_9]
MVKPLHRSHRLTEDDLVRDPEFSGKSKIRPRPSFFARHESARLRTFPRDSRERLQEDRKTSLLEVA